MFRSFSTAGASRSNQMNLEGMRGSKLEVLNEFVYSLRLQPTPRASRPARGLPAGGAAAASAAGVPRRVRGCAKAKADNLIHLEARQRGNAQPCADGHVQHCSLSDAVAIACRRSGSSSMHCPSAAPPLPVVGCGPVGRAPMADHIRTGTCWRRILLGSKDAWISLHSRVLKWMIDSLLAGWPSNGHHW